MDFTLLAVLAAAIRSFVEAVIKPLLLVPLYAKEPKARAYNGYLLVLFSSLVGVLAALLVDYDPISAALGTSSELYTLVLSGLLLGFGANIANEVLDILMRLKNRKGNPEEVVALLDSFQRVLAELASFSVEIEDIPDEEGGESQIVGVELAVE